MNIKEALIWAIKILKRKKIQSPALNAEILLAFAIKKPKEYLFAYPEKKLKNLEIKNFKKLINRRAHHEPVAYITGHKEFFGLDFVVNKNVLIPRPETELLVEETIKLLKTNQLTPKSYIIDIGTGSGAIIVSLAGSLPLPEGEVRRGWERPKLIAIDTSSRSLKIAKQNAKSNLRTNPPYPPLTRGHEIARPLLLEGQNKITFLRGNLIEPLFNQKLEISNLKLVLLANLPYLTTKEWRNSQPEIKKYEPRMALDGGPDGLKYFRELFRQINNLRQSAQDPRKSAFNKNPRLSAILEIGYNQAKAIKKLAKQYLLEYEVEIKKDLAGFDRLAIIK
jgi:release factor glutamine methyltransferase